MGRKKKPNHPPRDTSTKLVNQPSANSTKVQSGKTEFLAKEVARNPDVLERLMNSPETATMMMKVTHTRTGPLPDAAELARYEQITPGFATEILEMAKKEQAHRHSHLEKGQAGAIWRDRLGQIFALICVFVLALVAVYLIHKDAFWEAVTLLGVELVALTGVFVFGRNSLVKSKSPEENKKKQT